MDLAGLITLIAALAAAIVSIINAIKAPQMVEKKVAEVLHDTVEPQIERLHVIVNDRLTQLLATTEQAARAKGVLDEKTRATTEQAIRVKGAMDEKARAEDAQIKKEQT